MVPFTTPEAAWFVFLSGALAISTMILPGISGAFVLVLLGKYQFILDAINQRDLFVLGVFSLGMVVGIVGFVRILSWLFNKYHDLTVTVLTGIVIGSLRKIWPWKEPESVCGLPDSSVGEGERGDGTPGGGLHLHGRGVRTEADVAAQGRVEQGHEGIWCAGPSPASAVRKATEANAYGGIRFGGQGETAGHFRSIPVTPIGVG